MTDEDIRHLKKTELLKIRRDQEAELKEDREQIESLTSELSDKATHLEKCGSIAEASLEINNVFQSAQSAADQYLTEIKEKAEAADGKAEAIVAQAREKADAQIRAAADAARRLEAASRSEAEAYWSGLSEKLEAFYASHAGLKELLKASDIELNIPKPNMEKQQDE